ncbi:MAG TPA: hypothetical protein VNH39_12670 [Steroidobacteraceae bacterium]|nr:hypothetical protein [Steroidobacteraceae bacterium]
MSVATFLKYSANFFMGAALIKWVAIDVATEVRRDVESLQGRTQSAVRRSPYRIAGAVTAMGVVAGVLLAQHRRGG